MASKDFSAGTVYVQVLPSLDAWGERFQRQLEEKLGKLVAQVSIVPNLDAKAFQDELDKLTKNAKATITPEVHADPAQATKEAEKSAGAFAAAFRATIAAALKDLPEIDLDANATQADRTIDDVRAKLAELADVTIGVDLSGEEALAKLAVLRQRLAAVDGKDVHIRARTDLGAAITELEAFAARVAEVGRRDGGAFADAFTARVRAAMKALPDIELDANSTDVDRKLVIVRQELASLSDRRIGVDIDEGDALRKLAELHLELNQINRQAVTIRARVDTAQAVSQLDSFRAQILASGRDAEQTVAKIQARLNSLTGRRVTAQVDGAQAHAELEQLRVELERLGRDTASIHVRAEVGDALGKLALVRQELANLDRQEAHVQVDDGGSLHLTATRMQLLVGACVAAAGAIGGVGAALVALGAGAVVGGAGIAVVAGGLKQITGAMKAQTAASEQLGQTAQQEATQRLSAANQVLNAQDQLASATQGVADAQRSASNNVRSALEGQSRAEEQLQAAQVSALRAQRALTDARLASSRSIEDLQNRVKDDALAQRQAVLDLATAQDKLAAVQSSPGATQQQREEAQLALDEARQHLDEVSLSYRRSQVDAKAAAAAGVNGSRQVVDAQDALVQSQQQVRDADLSTQDAARKVAEARVTGAEQISRAQQQVIHAQRELAQAQAAVITQATHQGTAQDKLGDSLAKLTPQSQRLVEYLRAQTGEWDQVRRASQGFAPGLQVGLSKLEPLYSDINTNVATLSQSMGGFFSVIGDGLVTAQPFFDQISGASLSLMPRFGQTVNTAADAVGTLVVDMLPLAPVALDTVDAFSGLLKQLSPFIAQASGPLLTGLQQLAKNLQFLGPLLVNLAAPVADLTNALVSGLAAAFTSLTSDNSLGNFLQALVGLVKAVSPLIGDLGKLAAVAMDAFTPAIRAVTILITPLVGLVNSLVNLVTLVPAPVIAAASAFYLLGGKLNPLPGLLQKFNVGMSTSATVSDGFTKKVAGTLGSTSRLATAGEKVGSVFSKVGAALPFVGIAFAGISGIISDVAEQEQRAQQHADELGLALLKGGSAADEARIRLINLRIVADQTANSQDFFRRMVSDAATETANKVEESSVRQERSMTSVQLAQLRATQAQQDYDNALRDFGPDADHTVMAHEALVTASHDVRRAQQEAADAVKSHTEKLQEQQDQILAMQDAHLGLERAKLRLSQVENNLSKSQEQNKKDNEDVTAAQKALNAAIKEHGPRSDEAKQAQEGLTDAQLRAADSSNAIKEAQLDIVSAQSSYVASAGAAADASAKAAGAADTSAQKTHGQNEALIGLLQTQNVDLPPSILSMIAHMDDADKKFFGLNVDVGKTGDTILRLPGGPGKPPVEIKFHDNVREVEDNLKTLDDAVTNIQKNLQRLIPGGRDAPKAAGPPIIVYTPVGPQVLPRASGGGVPGSGSGDTVPAMLTPGEFVFSRPAVRNLGPSTVAAIHASAVRGYAGGGFVEPSGFAVGGPVFHASTSGGAGFLADLPTTFDDIINAINPLSLALRTRLAPAFQYTAETGETVQQHGERNWQAITSAIGTATSTITGGHLPALRTGLSLVDTAVGSTTTAFGLKWAQIKNYAAQPVREALAGPFNSGLIAAWNLINEAFAAGKPLAPLPIGFAAGGAVFGGTPGKDSVAAYLMPGEYVLPVDMVNQIGVSNLEAARRSVLAGGSVEGLIPGYEAGGAVTKALAFASAQQGKPYVWGAVGPDGYDCSGFMSAIANVVLGLSPYARRFTTADFAPGRGAGGFLPGRSSTFVIGVSDSHMAGNLAGHNIESTTKNGISGPRVDGDASGPTDPQFTKGQFFLPQIGGAFIPGPTAGTPFTVDSLLADTFASTRDAIAGLGSAFPGNTLAAGATAELTQMLGVITAWAGANLAASGGGGTGPAMDQIRAVAAKYGWGTGPEWAALSSLVDHESGGNPLAQNPSSTAFGEFQFLDSTWAGTGIAKTSDPTLQAEAGMRYIQGRYGDPVNAWRVWQSHSPHWYDNGGYLPPGLSLSYNGTGRPEPVIPADTWDAVTAGGGGGDFTGSLYLDSGQFLGQVRGEIHRAQDAIGSSLARRTR